MRHGELDLKDVIEAVFSAADSFKSMHSSLKLPGTTLDLAYLKTYLLRYNTNKGTTLTLLGEAKQFFCEFAHTTEELRC